VRATAAAPVLPERTGERGLRRNGLVFASMIGVLVFANWGHPQDPGGFFATVHALKWVLTGLCLLGLAAMLLAWFRRAELAEWVGESWGFAAQILPLLLAGVLVAGLLLGGPGGQGRGLIPSRWIAHLVGGNGLGANLFASVAGALMYFATLTEVPILDGLLHGGMGQGPALALLLAGPAVSLPNLLVIRSVLGTRKTLVYLLLVVGMSTAAGLIYGSLFGTAMNPQ